jgi:site-specific DNA recombinase
MSKRAVICARVSTAQQAEQGRSIESQLAAMRDYAALHGMDVVAEIQDDISGTVPIRERPGGRRLYELIKGRRADAVVFYTVDRITRDEDLIEINTIRRDCRNAGIELHYAADGGRADLSTWGGVIDTLKAAGAAEERKKIVERNARGRRAKAQAGRWVGTGDPPLGYRRAGHGKQSALEINESEAAVVRRIFEDYIGANGVKPVSVRSLVERLTAEGVPTPAHLQPASKANTRGWHTRSVNMILTRELYAGVLTYSDIRIEAPELAIITRSMFEAAQERKRRNKAQAARYRKRDYLLAGHIRCTCGRAMVGKDKRDRYRYYYCAGRSLPKHLRTCHEPFVTARMVEGEAWRWLESLCTDESALTAAIIELEKRTANDLEPMRAQLVRLDREIERERRAINVWVKSYPDASDDELEDLKGNVRAASARLESLRRDRDGLSRQIEQSTISRTQQRELLESVRLYREDILNADYEIQRFMLDRFNFVCRLRYDNAGTQWLDLALQLGGKVAIVTNSLQSVEHNHNPLSLTKSVVIKPAKPS